MTWIPSTYMFNKKQKNVRVYSSTGMHGRQFYVTVCSEFVFFSAVLFSTFVFIFKKVWVVTMHLGLEAARVSISKTT